MSERHPLLLPYHYHKFISHLSLPDYYFLMFSMLDNNIIASAGSPVALIIPVPCILYILQMVLTKAVLLRAVYELNREVASLVSYT